METATRAVMACALACVIGVFLPVGQLTVGGRLLSKHTSRSMYQLGHSSDAVREFLRDYQKSTTKKMGAKVLDKVAPHLPGRAQSTASDVQDVISTLDELRDEDVALVGKIISAVLWSFLVLAVLAAALAYKVTAQARRVRLVGAVVVAVLLAVLGVAIRLVLGRVVAEANAEIERDVFSLRIGALVMPAAALGVLASTIAVVVSYVRARRPAITAT